MMAYTDNSYRNWLFLVAIGIFIAQLLVRHKSWYKASFKVFQIISEQMQY